MYVCATIVSFKFGAQKCAQDLHMMHKYYTSNDIPVMNQR